MAKHAQIDSPQSSNPRLFLSPITAILVSFSLHLASPPSTFRRTALAVTALSDHPGPRPSLSIGLVNNIPAITIEGLSCSAIDKTLRLIIRYSFAPNITVAVHHFSLTRQASPSFIKSDHLACCSSLETHTDILPHHLHHIRRLHNTLSLLSHSNGPQHLHGSPTSIILLPHPLQAADRVRCARFPPSSIGFPECLGSLYCRKRTAHTLPPSLFDYLTPVLFFLLCASSLPCIPYLIFTCCRHAHYPCRSSPRFCLPSPLSCLDSFPRCIQCVLFKYPSPCSLSLYHRHFNLEAII
jgi:hypothetical protein